MEGKELLFWLFAGLAGGVVGEAHAVSVGGRTEVVALDSTSRDLYVIVEDIPEFPGGDVTKWLAKNTKYPEAALERGAEGKVFVQFTIEKDGRVSNVKVLRPVDPDLDREAVRVVSSMPRWKPGRQRGKFVRVSYTVPINFHLAKGKGKAVQKLDEDAYVMTGNRMTLPFFPGDWDEWIKERVLEEGYVYSEEKGVWIGLVVEADGRIAAARLRRDMDAERGTAALRLIEDMPKWVPGRLNGSPVRMRAVVRVPIGALAYQIVEVMPQFSGGDMTKWIEENVRYPEDVVGDPHGKVFVKFIVEADGRLTNVGVLKPFDPALDREAVRVVKSMPKWISGKHKGKPVRVGFIIPVSF